MSTAKLIYEAPFPPERWHDALAAIATDTGARAVTIATFNAVTRVGETIDLPIDLSFGRGSASFRANQNLAWDRGARLPVGEIFLFGTAPLREDFSRSASFVKREHAQKRDHAMGMRLIADGEMSVMITAYRSGSQSQFMQCDIDKMATLLPYLVRAIEIRRRLASSGSAEADLRTVLSIIGRAALIVDRSGRLLLANSYAKRLIEKGIFKLSKDGGVFVGNSDDSIILARLVKDAVAPNSKAGRMSIQCGSQRGLTALVSPLPGNNSVFSEFRALLLIDTANEQPETADCARLLRLQYGLTESEAALALRLAAGDSLRGVADERGISYATVRTHLARIFHKIGVHRQIDLFRLINKSGLVG